MHDREYLEEKVADVSSPLPDHRLRHRHPTLHRPNVQVEEASARRYGAEWTSSNLAANLHAACQEAPVGLAVTVELTFNQEVLMSMPISGFFTVLVSSIIGVAFAQAKEPSERASEAAAQPGRAAAAGCYSIGGGKYNCNVWRDATSYSRRDVPMPAGVLYQGTNYFYCQATGFRQTVGQYTNYWWAKTDDDSHNRDVWVNVVNISGGGNGQPVPGLPDCALAARALRGGSSRIAIGEIRLRVGGHVSGRGEAPRRAIAATG